MDLGYTIRASQVMLRHPVQGVERVRGRIDRRGDLRELEALGTPVSDFYGAAADWAPRLHALLDLPWPCPAADSFGPVWDAIVADLTSAGVRVGIRSYAGWNDGDVAFAEAIWCVMVHLRPGQVVETGVAHGLTSRVVLEALERNGRGHLWSIDLPAVDSALHSEIGLAISEDLRPRWTYVPGTARQQLPRLLGELTEIDVFIHDSLHTGRNQMFELESAWSAMRDGGVAVVDDIDHSLAFRTFVERRARHGWLAAKHVTGPGLAAEAGLWGLAVKGQAPTQPLPRARRPRAGRSAVIREILANPHYQALGPLMSADTARELRHRRIELAVSRQIARAVRDLAPPGARMLQIQAHHGQETLLLRDQADRPGRPVIYDQEDGRDAEARAATDFERVDLESGAFPDPDGLFDVVVWNRNLVTVKNAVPALEEARRVLRPGGFFVLTVPNLAALHNRALLLAGRQPTTLHINNGDHVRGFAVASMTRFLERDLGWRVMRVTGVGIAPLTGASLPRPLRGIGHTVVWVLRKPGGEPPGHSPPAMAGYRSGRA
jgi:ubiquinone/menaquinone biosynthesis C-methylase UbiE